MEEHGGRVEVETSNKGASFALRLPQEGQGAPARPKRPRLRTPDARIEELGPNSEAPPSDAGAQAKSPE